jgi:hypothetical protein
MCVTPNPPLLECIEHCTETDKPLPDWLKAAKILSSLHDGCAKEMDLDLAWPPSGKILIRKSEFIAQGIGQFIAFASDTLNTLKVRMKPEAKLSERNAGSVLNRASINVGQPRTSFAKEVNGTMDRINSFELSPRQGELWGVLQVEPHHPLLRLLSFRAR